MSPKVHPLSAASSSSLPSSSSSSYVSSKRETFTIWMKSLVLQGHGCTVYNQNGNIVYRIDNYEKKGSNEVYLMDLRGKVLYTILRKVRVFGRWRGYKNDGVCSMENEKKPSFIVRRDGKVTVLDGEGGGFRLEGLLDDKSGSGLKIIDGRGEVVAEAKRKESSTGVVLGEDVLSLVVEGDVDHSLVMALVTVYGLRHHIL